MEASRFTELARPLIGIGTPDRRYNSSLLLTQVTNEQKWFAGSPGKAIE
jgi:hypothetical protein